MGKIEGRDMKTMVYLFFGELGGCLLQTFTSVKNEGDHTKLVSWPAICHSSQEKLLARP